ncbi:unnamed protein product [Paramecium sonneborni]|uniref:Uncharacterized protein n=1 Tax=Paramecium sonneborni TaxID=65129 RepID=A0A8S1PEA7_9CILI|nr:unnamed protein product [Paramecium sonneborni]
MICVFFQFLKSHRFIAYQLVEDYRDFPFASLKVKKRKRMNKDQIIQRKKNGNKIKFKYEFIDQRQLQKIDKKKKLEMIIYTYLIQSLNLNIYQLFRIMIAIQTNCYYFRRLGERKQKFQEIIYYESIIKILLLCIIYQKISSKHLVHEILQRLQQNQLLILMINLRNERQNQQNFINIGYGILVSIVNYINCLN